MVALNCLVLSRQMFLLFCSPNINEGRLNNRERPVRIMQHSSTALQTPSSKIIIQSSERLSKTVSIKIQYYNLHKGGFIAGLLY